jgi:hypothetical protein
MCEKLCTCQKVPFGGKPRSGVWQTPDGEWFEWFWSFKTEQKVFEKFLGAEYNSLKPLKPLKPHTTIGKHRWGMRGATTEWFFGVRNKRHIIANLNTHITRINQRTANHI